MSDFILPEHLAKMAQQSAQDIADGWDILTNACVLRQYPIDIAENKVHAYVAGGLSEIESLRKVFYEVVKN